jgi:release factor glutamine methyltransferase
MNQKLLNIKNTLDKSRKLNTSEFFVDLNGLEIQVDPNVFSPIYFEDSYFFAENMIDIKGLDVLEIGTGTGYFAIKMALNKANKVVATDVSKSAYNNALVNMEKLSLEDKVDIRLGSIFEPILNEKFDVIFWNIPFCYIEESTKNDSHISGKLDELESAVFNSEYKLLQQYRNEGFKFLNKNGKLLLGFSPTIGNKVVFDNVVLSLGLSYKAIVNKEVEMDGHKEILQIIEFYQ